MTGIVIRIVAMTVAVIPSRYASKRFEGKPLALLAGKPMIQWVCEQAEKSETVSRVVVATDDIRIAETVRAFGGEVLMTSSVLRSGTDRVAQAADMLNLPDDEVVVNIQGDQPLFDPACLDILVAPFSEEKDLNMSTLACHITDQKRIENPKNVKVTFDRQGYALYFSRAAIPWPRDTRTHAQFYKHLGFYAYRQKFLRTVTDLETGRYEDIEKLEQLRVMEAGYRIKVCITTQDAPGVDLPEDLEAIEKTIEKQFKTDV